MFKNPLKSPCSHHDKMFNVVKREKPVIFLEEKFKYKCSSQPKTDLAYKKIQSV